MGARAGRRCCPHSGTKRRKYLEENVGALEIDLTIDDLHRLNEVFPRELRRASVILST